MNPIIVSNCVFQNLLAQHVGIGTSDPKALLPVADSSVVFSTSGGTIANSTTPVVGAIGVVCTKECLQGPDNSHLSNAMVVYKNGNNEINGFTSLCNSSEAAPAIKMKKLTGVSAILYMN